MDCRFGFWRSYNGHVKQKGQSRWPRGLRRGAAAARLLGLRVRIPPRAWTSVSYECCVLCCQVKSLCDRPMPRPEESYWVCVCVCPCDQMQHHWVGGKKSDYARNLHKRPECSCDYHGFVCLVRLMNHSFLCCPLPLGRKSCISRIDLCHTVRWTDLEACHVLPLHLIDSNRYTVDHADGEVILMVIEFYQADVVQVGLVMR